MADFGTRQRPGEASFSHLRTLPTAASKGTSTAGERILFAMLILAGIFILTTSGLHKNKQVEPVVTTTPSSG